MPLTEELLLGLELTLTGMVTVFLLLNFMVLLIQWMSKLAHRLQPPKQTQPLKTQGAATGSLEPALIAVIGAAIHRYRSKHR